MVQSLQMENILSPAIAKADKINPQTRSSPAIAKADDTLCNGLFRHCVGGSENLSYGLDPPYLS